MRARIEALFVEPIVDGEEIVKESVVELPPHATVEDAAKAVMAEVEKLKLENPGFGLMWSDFNLED